MGKMIDGLESSLRKLQTSLPWTIKYSQDFRSNPQTHKDFAHSLVHVAKALGKLMGLVDDMDHDRATALDPKLAETYGKYVADLVVCALRAANTFPGGKLDLQSAVEQRIKTKNDHVDDARTYVATTNPRLQALIDWSNSKPRELYRFVALDAEGRYLGLFTAPDIEQARKLAGPSATVVKRAESWK